MGSDGLTDHRYEGYSDAELADVIDQLGAGPGAERMTRAANILDDVATSLRQIDSTLAEQLGAIGVCWQSKQSSSLAKDELAHSQDYGEGAHGQVTVSARSVSDQGDAYNATRLGLPDSGSLRQNPAEAAGTSFTGNATDYTNAVRDRSQTRHQAIDALNNYGHSSSQNLAAHHPLPPVRPVHVSTHTPPAAGDSTSPSAYVAPSICNPSAGAGGPSAAAGYLPQGPVVTGAPTLPIPALGNSGAPVTGGGVGGVGGMNTGGELGSGPGGVTTFGAVPGAGVPGSGANLGGNSSGGQPGSPNSPGFGARMTAGPVEGGAAPPAAGQVAGAARGIPAGAMNNAATGAVLAGGAGSAAAAGAGAERERLVRGRGGFGGPQSPRGGNVVGEEPDEHSAASRAAAKVGSTSAARRSMLEPATGSSREEEDGEHVRRFGVEADDLFTDQRPVVAPVLGDDEEPTHNPTQYPTL